MSNNLAIVGEIVDRDAAEIGDRVSDFAATFLEVGFINVPYPNLEFHCEPQTAR